MSSDYAYPEQRKKKKWKLKEKKKFPYKHGGKWRVQEAMKILFLISNIKYQTKGLIYQLMHIHMIFISWINKDFIRVQQII